MDNKIKNVYLDVIIDDVESGNKFFSSQEFSMKDALKKVEDEYKKLIKEGHNYKRMRTIIIPSYI